MEQDNQTNPVQEAPISIPDIYNSFSGNSTMSFKDAIVAMERALSFIEKIVWDFRAIVERCVGEGTVASRVLSRGLPVATTTMKIVYSYRIAAITNAFRSRASIAEATQRLHRRNGTRLRDLALRQGAGLIKVGQIIAGRGDILPTAFIEPLRALQTDCSAMPWDEVSLKLGTVAWLDDCHINVEPVGAASIAQVHHGRKDGQDFAVKVWRPQIRELLEVDMMSVRFMLDAMAVYLPQTDIDDVITELESSLLHEADSELEARNTEKMTRLLLPLLDTSKVGIPKPVFSDGDAGVVVYEFIEGISLDQHLAAKANEGDSDSVNEMLARLADVYARQIITLGFVQPDAHSGNFMVDTQGKLMLLDFGNTTTVTVETRQAIQASIRAFMQADDEALAVALNDLGIHSASGNLTDHIACIRGQVALMFQDDNMAWDKDNLLEASQMVMSTFSDDPIASIPPDLVMIGRALLSLGGMFMQYSPPASMLMSLAPILFGPIEELA